MESINKQLNIREDGRGSVYQKSLASFDPNDFRFFGGFNSVEGIPLRLTPVNLDSLTEEAKAVIDKNAKALKEAEYKESAKSASEKAKAVIDKNAKALKEAEYKESAKSASEKAKAVAANKYQGIPLKTIDIDSLSKETIQKIESEKAKADAENKTAVDPTLEEKSISNTFYIISGLVLVGIIGAGIYFTRGK